MYMKNRIKKWVLLVLGLGIITVGLLPNISQNIQISSFSYASSSLPPPGPGQKKVVLKNLGMSCPFCKAAVSAKLKQLPGVIAYDVDWKSDTATVLYDPGKVTIEEIKQAIAQTGFQVRGVEEVSK